MAVPATEAIIFDCFGVLYKTNESLVRRQALNTELIVFITEKLKPYYKVGLLSNIDRDWINHFIDKHKLHGLFDAVVVSGDEATAKPHPSIYQRISEELGIKVENCIMIDDLVENCEGAESAGMRAIHYLSHDELLADLKKNLVLNYDCY